MSDQPTVHLHRCGGTQAGTGAQSGLSGEIIIITRWLYDRDSRHHTASDIMSLIQLDGGPVEKAVFSVLWI